jgi:hypothetical protein
MRFDKEMPKKRRKREEHKLVQEVPEESIEEAVEETAEEVPAEPAEVPAAVEELKSKEVYETGEGTAVLQYDKAPKKRGYVAPSKKEGFCEIREKTKAVYGIKYAAGKGVDLVKKAKAAIMDWCLVLHKKGPQRKDEEELI